MQSYNDFLQLVERKQEALDLIKLIKKMPTDYKLEVTSWDHSSDMPKKDVNTIRLETGTDLIRALSHGDSEVTIGKGISYEGGGYFSTVYSGSSSKVFKERQYVIKHSKPGRSGEQDRWQDFAALAQKNESNPLFPKVLYFREFEHGEMLAVLEYLTIDADRSRSLGVDKGRFRVVGEFANIMNRKDVDRPNRKHAERAVSNYAKELGIDPKHLADFLVKVNTLNAELDIHAFNVGWRGKQMVIFDPVSWNADYGAEGL